MALRDGIVTVWDFSRNGYDRVGNVDLLVAGTGEMYHLGPHSNRRSAWLTGTWNYTVPDPAPLDFGDSSWEMTVNLALLAKATTAGIVSKFETASNRAWLLQYNATVDRFRWLIFNNGGTTVLSVDANALGSPKVRQPYQIVVGQDTDENIDYIYVNNGVGDTAVRTGTSGTGTNTAAVRVGAYQGDTARATMIVSEITFRRGPRSRDRRTQQWNGGLWSYHPFVGPTESPDHRTLVVDGNASWWCLPKAVELDGTLYLSGVNQQDNTAFVAQRAVDGTVSTFDVKAWVAADEHNVPAILVPSNAVPIVVYCGHNDDSLLRFRKGTTIGDITSLGAETTLTAAAATTYAQIHRESTNGSRLFVFTRVGSNDWHYTKSTDYGATWAALAPIIDETGNLVYIHSHSSGDRVDIFLVGHPNNSTLRGVYHCYLDMPTETLYKTDGTVIGTLAAGPYAATALTVVHEPAGTDSMRFFSGIGAGGSPTCLVAKWLTTDKDSGVFYVYRWNGSSFDESNHGATGSRFGYETSNYLSGGDFENANSIVVVTEDDGKWTMERRVTTDAWTSWSVETLMTSISGKILRPYVPVGASAHKVIAAFASDFGDGDYTSWNTDFVEPAAVVDSTLTTARIVSAINGDATIQTLQTNASTAATDAQLAAAVLANKNNVLDNLDGTYDIAIRNAADDATLRTIRYNPSSGAKAVV